MLKDLLKQSRSYRSFDKDVRISPEQLADWIDHTRYCPSSVNLQMLKFRPVTDPTECDALFALTRWAGKIKEIKLPPMGHEPVAYIVICSDASITPTASSFQTDVGICAQTVMLAACEAGFGGCMIGSFSKEAVKELFALPAFIQPELVLALGKPDECVRLVNEAPDGSVTYYRKNGIHYVQKRTLEHLILS